MKESEITVPMALVFDAIRNPLRERGIVLLRLPPCFGASLADEF
jgi:hypothetical protein